jgi:cysteine synthase A
VDAFAACHELRRQTGIGVGGSSGAVIAAFAQMLDRGERFRRPVLIIHDGGHRYENTLYSAGWLRDRNLDITTSTMAALEFMVEEA